MEAYFDNSATTIVTDSVKDIVVKTMTEDFGNPSAMHMVGVKAEKYIKEAQENIAKILKVDPKEIFFTSGGTESNNIKNDYRQIEPERQYRRTFAKRPFSI